MKTIKKWIKNFLDIDASPHHKALGLGIGVFLGILPGAGPVIALAAAAIFKANKAAAVLGAFLVNTWTTIITIAFSVKVGAFVTGQDGQEALKTWNTFIHDFHWSRLWEGHLWGLVYPILIGYFIISAAFGLLAYFFALFVLNWHQNKKTSS